MDGLVGEDPHTLHTSDL